MSTRLLGSGDKLGILNNATARSAAISTSVHIPALQGPRTRVAVLNAVGSSVKCGATESHTFITCYQLQ